ncbi:hypothetical protein [Paenibacillus crassostreae]|uniref:Phospholipase C/D domain-containing protein n=2 Tax=Paenibacillus crassostreae TaxID=1763538 RepID=A0A167BWL4_9BACL|nr:hypothetical protein [Paenibacillus crassostreae]AOZ92576.1 hypothetical protein LPB68_10230 [Paenibacillus crassostreae]OAB72525.1 hypothetical protein PNBC_16675 [Paenibacillus crassostreae]
MPWPMVHFAISEILSFGDPSPNLLLGSISPDAIHMRGQISREEKGVTHLVHNGKLPNKELIMERYREYLPKRMEPEWKSFVVGYFSHIYTDLRWTETIYTDFENNYNGDKNEIRKTYNNEVSQVEFYLLRALESKDKLLVKLEQAKGYSVDPFLTQLEINQYRDCKINWLEDLNNEPQITPIYFKNDKVMNFIRETAKEFLYLNKEWNIECFEDGRNIS